MDRDDILRKETEQQFRQYPQMEKLPPHMGTYADITPINNEIDRLRKEEQEKRDREQRGY